MTRRGPTKVMQKKPGNIHAQNTERNEHPLRVSVFFYAPKHRCFYNAGSVPGFSPTFYSFTDTSAFRPAIRPGAVPEMNIDYIEAQSC